MSCKAAVILGTVVLLAVLVRQGLTMECYNCVNCNDPFDAKKYKDETINCTGSCTKAKANGVVTRMCLALLKQNDCKEEGDDAVCQCTENLCNSTLKIQTPVCLIVFLTAASLLRKYVL